MIPVLINFKKPGSVPNYCTMQQVMEYSEEGLVSADIIGNTHSAVIDSLSTNVLKKRVVKGYGLVR